MEEGFFTDKKILVIGGTGTIGKNIVKTILKDKPKVIRIISRDEYKQFMMRQEFDNYENLRFLIGDVRECERIVKAMQDIDYVFHTAAMKQVPACEYDPFEAVKTNVIGTQNVISASISAKVKKTIFISTDKAIAPTNTYGATKLMAERLIASAQYNNGNKYTRFAAVRFGNVMGSRGSVIPLFIKQIGDKRKVTVTDLKMSRFMMTLKQATELTIKAMQIAYGGEIFILKMPIINLKDLAEVIIECQCSKLHINPDDIEIEEIGIRPGEKMYEELMNLEESHIAFETEDMFILPNSFLKNDVFYKDFKKAKIGSYSSNDKKSISKRELKSMLEENNLI